MDEVDSTSSVRKVVLSVFDSWRELLCNGVSPLYSHCDS